MRPRPSRYDRVKRVIDVIVAAAGLVVLAPLLGSIAIAVLVVMGRPVLFRQERPGRTRRVFVLVKFRTMRPAASGGVTALVSDADRLTRIGRLLRATSLDELPSLWNVLTGDMSLIGPRPLLPEYLPRFTEAQARRHDVAPGITGLAQVRGRNAISWDERLAYDIKYVNNRGPALDFKIIAETVRTVARREGIASDGSATMPEFKGQERPVPPVEPATSHWLRREAT